MAQEFTVLTKFNEFIALLIKNGIYDENTISDLMKNIEEGDSETKLERILENMESRDPEDIDKFAILLRDSEFVTEEMLSQDECDSVLKTVNRKLLVHFKDLLSSPKACGEDLMVVKAKKIKSTENGDVYKMTSRPRGFCFIINNQNFSVQSKLRFRAGSRADAHRLQNVFTQLGFTVSRYTDQTKSQMESLFKRLSTNDELRYHDALAVIILSHGAADGIYGSDGDLITVDSIIDLFNNVNCPLMVNKPRMFFLMACRGGYVSHRNLSIGSWFGYELAHTLAECAHIEHLNDLVTIKVGKRLQDRETKINGNFTKQAIETLIRGGVKKLYFNPGF